MNNTDEDDEEEKLADDLVIQRKDFWIETLQLFINKMHTLASKRNNYIKPCPEVEMQLCLMLICEPWLLSFVEKTNQPNNMLRNISYACEFIGMTYHLMKEIVYLRSAFQLVTSFQHSVGATFKLDESIVRNIAHLPDSIKVCFTKVIGGLDNPMSYGDICAQIHDGPNTNRSRTAFARQCLLLPTTVNLETTLKSNYDVIYFGYWNYLKTKYSKIGSFEADIGDAVAINRSFFLVWHICVKTQWYDTTNRPPWFICAFKQTKILVVADEKWILLVKRCQLLLRRYGWYKRHNSEIDIDPYAPYFLQWFKIPELMGMSIMGIAMSIIDYSPSRLLRMMLPYHSPLWHIYRLLPRIIECWNLTLMKDELCISHANPGEPYSITHAVVAFLFQSVPHFIRYDYFMALYEELTTRHAEVIEKYTELYTWWTEQIKKLSQFKFKTEPQENSTYQPPQSNEPDGWCSADENNAQLPWINICHSDYISLDYKKINIQRVDENGNQIINNLLQEFYYLAMDTKLPMKLRRVIIKAIFINISLPTVRRSTCVGSYGDLDDFYQSSFHKEDLLVNDTLISTNTTSSNSPLLQPSQINQFATFLYMVDSLVKLPKETVFGSTAGFSYEEVTPILRPWILTDMKRQTNPCNIYPIYSKCFDNVPSNTTPYSKFYHAAQELHELHENNEHYCKINQAENSKGWDRIITIPRCEDSCTFRFQNM